MDAVFACQLNGCFRCAVSVFLRLGRFDILQREPELAAAQINLLFAGVPQLADAVQTAHPELSQETATAIGGAVIGAVAAALTHSQGELRTRLNTALATLRESR